MKNKILLLSLLASVNALASYPETFGASFSTRMIGHMSNLDSEDPANNFYAPSILGFSKKVNVSLEATSNATHFKPISNVVVTNATNSNSSTATYGNVRTDYNKYYGSGMHFGLPIGYPEHGTLGTLGISLYIPIGSLLETNSGSPFLPEYVMYRARHQRTSLYVNFSHQSTENFAWSLGAIVGFQASADVVTNLSLNGTSYGSWAQAKTKIDPSLGAIVSAAYKFSPNMTSYFTYQQEMKSNLDAHASGQINNPSAGLFDANIKSVIFYEPHTFRLGTNYKLTSDLEVFAGAEYQLWTNYKTPKIEIIKNGGVVVASSDYERLQLRNIIQATLGTRYLLTNRITIGLGATYHQSPFNGSFSGAGNSIDTDTYILSTGLTYRIVIWSKDVTVGPSFEYHLLKEKKVVKTSNDETGAAGSKIGAPGYTIGGYILAAGLGVKFNF